MALQTKVLSVNKGCYLYPAYDIYTLKLTLTENSTSVSNNTSNISYKLELINNNLLGVGFAQYGIGWTIKLGGQTVSSHERQYAEFSCTVGQTTKLVEGSANITHGSDGTLNMSVSVEMDMETGSSGADRFTPGPMSISGSMALTAIPRASTMTAGNFAIGTAGTFTITKASSSFKHVIKYSFGNTSGTAVSSTDSATPSWTPPASLGAQIPAATSGNITFTLETWNGSTKVGESTLTKTLSIPSSWAPTISSVTAVPVSSVTARDNEGIYAAGASKVKVTTSASASSGSSISGYAITGGAGTGSGTPWTSSTLTSGSKTITVTVTDRRGRTASKSVTITVYGPSSMSFPAFTIGSAGTFSISKSLSSFKHSISISLGSRSAAPASLSTASSVSWTPPDNFGDQITAATSRTVSATITTYTAGGNLVGSTTYNVTINIPSSWSPSLTTVNLSQSSANAWVNGQNNYISGYSKVTVSVPSSGAAASKYASISSVSITGGAGNGTPSWSSGASWTSPVLSGSGTISIKVKITDSRGKTAEKTVTLTLLAYSSPTVRNAYAHRSTGGEEDPSGTDLTVYGVAAYSSSIPGLSYAMSFRVRTVGGTYGDAVTLPSGNETTLEDGVPDVTKRYEVLIRIEDSVGNASEALLSIDTERVTINVRNGGNAVGIGTYTAAEKEFTVNPEWTIKKGDAPTLANLPYCDSVGGTLSSVGWKRVAKLDADGTIGGGVYLVSLGSIYAYTRPSTILLAVAFGYDAGKIYMLADAGTHNVFTKARLIHTGGGNSAVCLDIYYVGYTGASNYPRCRTIPLVGTVTETVGFTAVDNTGTVWNELTF